MNLFRLPKVGEWVSYVGMDYPDLPSECAGIVLDFARGGPDYPPCIVVAWDTLGDIPGIRWNVRKMLPETIVPYIWRERREPDANRPT